MPINTTITLLFGCFLLVFGTKCWFFVSFGCIGLGKPEGLALYIKGYARIFITL